MKTTTIMAACAAILSVSAAGLADEVISRSWTVENARPASATDTASRASTVLNELPAAMLERDSRAATILNTMPPNPSEAISRATTICNAADLNNDGQVTVADIDQFANVLVGIDTDWSRTLDCDVNCDDVTNGHDVKPFVELLID